MAFAPGAAGGADERLAVEESDSVVVSEHAKEMIVARFQPFDQFIFMPKRRVIGVVAVEEGDADDVVGNRFHLVDITESETAAAAMAGQHDFRVSIENASNAINDVGEQ